MHSSQNIQSADLATFIKQLENDLHVAQAFYAMQCRRNGGPVSVPAAFASEEPVKARKVAKQKAPKVVKATRKPKAAKPAPVKEVKSGKAPRAPHGEIKRSILEAISKCSTQYTMRDVAFHLGATGISDGTISIMLGKLTKDALVNRVQEGSGRKPAIYRQLTVPMKVEADVAFPDPDPV